jgi:hypothetical protein
MIANIAQSLAVPLTLIPPDAVMVAAPADCIRSPVSLLPVGVLVLATVALLAVRVTSAPNIGEAVLLAALTAFPPGLFTMTPG